MENYLAVLEDSLVKKSRLLDEISEYNEKQKELFSEGNADFDAFDESLERKEELINKVLKLDEGFDILYNRVSEQLRDNKSLYAEHIKRMQGLVKEVTDKNMAVQAQEAENKRLIEDYFKARRTEIGQNRRNADNAYKFYKTMSNANAVQTSTWESKN